MFFILVLIKHKAYIILSFVEHSFLFENRGTQKKICHSQKSEIFYQIGDSFYVKLIFSIPIRKKRIVAALLYINSYFHTNQVA